MSKAATVPSRYSAKAASQTSGSDVKSALMAQASSGTTSTKGTDWSRLRITGRASKAATAGKGMTR